MTGTSFRTPELADANVLSALGRETFIETFGALYAEIDLAGFLEEAFGPSGLPADISDPSIAIRVAEADGQMIGFCKVGPCKLTVPDDSRRKCELRQLYILKEWQGSGIAHPLMDWALSWANAGGFDDMYLSVWSENFRAQKFYGNYGFEKAGDITFMVGTQADHDFLYRLKLKP